MTGFAHLTSSLTALTPTTILKLETACAPFEGGQPLWEESAALWVLSQSHRDIGMTLPVCSHFIHTCVRENRVSLVQA